MSQSASLYEGSISPAEAVRRMVAATKRRAEAEPARLDDAFGGYVADDLVAPGDLPARPNAAVDGYAVNAAFAAAHPDHTFEVIGRAAAGHPCAAEPEPGQAVRVFTGAVMPKRCDAVAMQEFCTADESSGTVRLARPVREGLNCRPAGENLKRGEVIARAGKRLGAVDIGLAAAAGFDRIALRRRLAVALVSMGDELVEPGAKAGHGRLHDSNRPMLRAMIGDDGYETSDLGIQPDGRDELVAAYERGLAACDALISSGGASDSEQDHTQPAMRALGIEPVFWRLAIKPGRPMSAGVRDGVPLFCLPGNPVAAFVCYRLVVAPVLAHIAGGAPRAPLRVPARAGFEHKGGGGRAEYLRVRIERDADGRDVMMLHGRRGAGVLSSLAGAHGLVEIPVDNEGVDVGDWLDFIPFRETGL